MPKRSDNRQSLLDAGLAILAEKPPEDISMDEVAARAGVTKPMVYYYFGSKIGFYQSLVDHVEISLNKLVDTCLEEGLPFREVLKRIIISRVDQVVNRPEFSNAVRMMATSRVICGAESRARIIKLFNRLEPVFRKSIEQGDINRNADLQLVMGMLNSLMDGAFRIKGREFFTKVDPEVFADRITGMIFDGIGTGKRES